MKISNFMRPGDKTIKPRPGSTYRWARREMARQLYRMAKHD